MGSIRRRDETGHLYFDFRVQGKRYREQSTLEDSPTNRQAMEETLAKIESEAKLGTFVYEKYFPKGKLAAASSSTVLNATMTAVQIKASVVTPTLLEFSELFFSENEVRWRINTRNLNRTLLNRHILPKLGDRPVASITRADVLGFRAEVAKPRVIEGRDTPKVLTSRTVNMIMGLLRMMLMEASQRYEHLNPTAGIKFLKEPKKDIQPFTLEEAWLLINTVRPDYRNYLLVRIFTGMRTGEVHGLKWSQVDFERRQIKVRETFCNGRTEYTKNDGSQRDIDISSVVLEALLLQKKATAPISEYVFCNKEGHPLDAKNVTNRVWYPLLRLLNLAKRRPYECRHTCATFWLASGEAPEWIARQLGHTTTEMLFRVYSRYVPNLTRKDGSAFETLIAQSRKPSNESKTELPRAT